MSLDCFLQRREINTGIFQPCDEEERTYFRDLTGNHNKTFVFIENFTGETSDCSLTITFVTDAGTIPRTLTPEQTEARFLFENLRGISAVCSGDNSEGECNASLNITKFYCICCD